MSSISLAIIGGSGFYQPGMLTEVKEVSVSTPYGEIKPLIGRLQELTVAFLPRHGRDHSALPHQVNYRANLWGLHHLGVSRIVATTAVGSLQENLPPGTLVLMDQFMDFTRQRPLTFFEQGEVHRAHIDLTEPYCSDLRVTLLRAADACNLLLHNGGCYVCTEGPRYETAAEVRAFKLLGGTVVGMTGVPEVVLARELGICYANVSMITNFAAGISKVKLEHADVVRIMNDNQIQLRKLLTECLLAVKEPFGCSCGK